MAKVGFIEFEVLDREQAVTIALDTILGIIPVLKMDMDGMADASMIITDFNPPIIVKGNSAVITQRIKDQIEEVVINAKVSYTKFDKESLNEKGKC